jgi:DNA helicase-2/ATP-dependent DNA helicase PcrA
MAMANINLSVKQQAIVDLNEGPHLVIASAGSGKTRVLTERVKHLVQTSKGKILAITFTNKAAEELRERLVVNEIIKDKVFIGTFHSFCQSILELRFKLLGFNSMPHVFEDNADRIELIEQAIDQVPYFKNIYSGLEQKKRSEYKYSVLDFISQVKRELASPEEIVTSGNEEFLLLYEVYQDILISNNGIDFDDIILLIYKLLTNNESVANLYRKSYDYVCVDEAQDLNKAQYFLLKALLGETCRNVMMVGDPNQSIFAFNGSSPEYMQKYFVEELHAITHYLTDNYRCSRAVIDASNKLMGLNTFSVNYVIPGVFKISGFETEEDEAKAVIEKIEKLCNLKVHSDIEGEITYERISVLARNKYVFKPLEDLLKKAKIPYFYKTGGSGLKFSSSCMQLFDCYFRVKLNPLDKLHLSRLQTILKVTEVFNEEILRKNEVRYATHILRLINILTTDNFTLELKKFSKIFEDNQVVGLTEDDRRLIIYDIDELLLSWKEYQIKNQKRTLLAFKNSISLGTTQAMKSEQGITLSTVHTMKGQESDIVFIIGMDEGTFPDYRATLKGGVDLQQEKNNAYVAFTRAKRFLYITFPKSRIMPWGDTKARSSSRFLNPFKT